MRASLGSHGYRVIEAERAAEVGMLATSHSPQLILLDLGLPDGDGIEVTRKLREWSRVPIIVVSARGREEDKVAALDARLGFMEGLGVPDDFDRMGAEENPDAFDGKS